MYSWLCQFPWCLVIWWRNLCQDKTLQPLDSLMTFSKVMHTDCTVHQCKTDAQPKCRPFCQVFLSWPVVSYLDLTHFVLQNDSLLFLWMLSCCPWNEPIITLGSGSLSSPMREHWNFAQFYCISVTNFSTVSECILLEIIWIKRTFSSHSYGCFYVCIACT